MVFGCKARFAIECDIRRAVEGFVICGFRFWIGGEPIGEWQEDCVLGVLIHSAQVTARYTGQRGIAHEPLLQGLAAEPLLQRIAEGTFGLDPDPVLYEAAQRDSWNARYLLHVIADESVGYVGYFIVTVTVGPEERILYKKRDIGKRNGAPVHEIRGDNLAIDAVIAAFLDWARLQNDIWKGGAPQ